MVCVSVAFTVFVIHIAGNTHPVPPTMKRIFLDILQRILWPGRRDLNRFHKNFPDHQTPTEEEGSITTPGIELSNENNCICKQQHDTSIKSRSKRCMNNYMDTTNSNHGNSESDWKAISRVVDRCLLIILVLFLLFLTVIVSLHIYLSARDHRNIINDHDGIELIHDS